MIDHKNYVKMPENFHAKITDSLKEIDKMSTSKRVTNKPLQVAVVSLAIVVILSISIFAGYSGYKSFISKTKDNQISLSTALLGEVKQAPEYATIEIGYLPEGTTPTDDYQKYDYNGKSGFTFCLYKASDISNFLIDNVANYEECKFGNHLGAVLRKTYTGMNKEGIVYFEDMGCVVRFYADRSIADEEINKIAENIKVVETNRENSWGYDLVITESVSQRAE